MLLSLHIENLAVIRSVDLDFPCGFTVLSGETGAGKSVIIDSIHLLLGSKADKELIRSGEPSAMVSGLFGDFSPLVASKLADLGVTPDEEGNILVQRTVSRDGKSSVRFNGRAVTLAVLHSVVPLLVTIHGQNDTRSLTNPEHHLEYLDVYGDHLELLSQYRAAYGQYEHTVKEIRRISAAEREREREMEMLAFQIQDIDSVGAHENEEDELIDKKLKVRSAERIRKNSSFVFKALKGSEKGSASYLIDRSIAALTQLSDVYPKLAESAESLRECLWRVDEVAEEAYDIASELDRDADADLNEIESRLDKIARMKRKYGLTVADCLLYRETAAKRLAEMENAEQILKDLEKCEAEQYEAALVLAERLHECRRRSAERLENTVKQTLDFLDMPKVVFFASIKEEYDQGKKVLSPLGFDQVEFYISANRGAEPQPLARIASGGELARIMLAIKCALADKDGIPTLIFDEVDAGVSGKTARKIGMKMHELATVSQVIAVTHSAQIASLADGHFLIRKSDVNGITETGVKLLDYEGRVAEISRILGGIDVTPAQREAAIDMLKDRMGEQSV